MALIKEAVLTDNAPPPLPQFSQAIKYNGMVYCSGSIGVDSSTPTETIVKGGVEAEARVAFRGLSAVLEAAGSSLHNVVKINIFLTTTDDFDGLNKVYDEVLADVNPKPCRTCVAVHQLPLGAKVEIECIAFVNPE
ncbi:L-psp endoribonuclease family protein [Xylaria cf. heliscus]|nr:L-psp endoribonuclease family protein [Xylaria cf. heliscus]